MTQARRSFFTLRVLVVVCAPLILSACAGQSVFYPYPLQAESIRQAIAEGAESSSAVEELQKKLSSEDRLLYALELGRMQQSLDNYQASKQAYELAISEFEKQDLQATIRARDIAATGASFLTNDNALPYKGAGYERIAAHHFQALNYWAEKDFEGAAVEFRKVALEQAFLIQKHAKELDEAAADLDQQNLSTSIIEEQLPSFDASLSGVRSSFLNAYTYFTSGLFREYRGELNDARVDYLKALEIKPDSELIDRSLLRVRAKQGELSPSQRRELLDTHKGELVILFEEGFVPAQREFALNVPSFTGKFISIAFPFYSNEQWPQEQALQVKIPEGAITLETEPLVNYGALAVKHAQEQMSGRLARQVARSWSKYELQRQTGESFGLLGQFAANIYTIVSERADLRSWLTLPFTGQAQSISLSPGSHNILLTSGGFTEQIEVQIQKSKPTVLYVLKARSKLRVKELPM